VIAWPQYAQLWPAFAAPGSAAVTRALVDDADTAMRGIARLRRNHDIDILLAERGEEPHQGVRRKVLAPA